MDCMDSARVAREELVTERMMRWVGWDSRVDLGETKSSGWQQWCSVLQADLSHLLDDWWGLYQISGIPRNMGQGPGDLLVLRWEGRGMGCSLEIRFWRLEQLSWEGNQSLFLPSSMDCACSYGVCQSCKKGLAMRNIMRWVELSDRVGLGEIESSGWPWWWWSLLAGLSPVGWLMGFAEKSVLLYYPHTHTSSVFSPLLTFAIQLSHYSL